MALEDSPVLEGNETFSKEDELPEALASSKETFVADVGAGVVVLGAFGVSDGAKVVDAVDEGVDEIDSLPLELVAVVDGEVVGSVIVSAVAVAASAIVSTAASIRDSRMVLPRCRSTSEIAENENADVAVNALMIMKRLLLVAVGVNPKTSSPVLARGWHAWSRLSDPGSAFLKFS